MEMAKDPASELGKVIEGLRTRRQKHSDAIATIDEVFTEYGIQSRARARRRKGRPAATKKKVRKKVARRAGKKKAVKKKTGREFSKSGDQFVLDLLKHGRQLTTAKINGKWKQAGRGGSADNTLTKLTQASQLKRQSVAGVRGSTYRAR